MNRLASIFLAWLSLFAAAFAGDRDAWFAVTRHTTRQHTKVTTKDGRFLTVRAFSETRLVFPAAAANPIRWATKYHDAETGLYYFGRRYYDPRTAQWLTREPLGESESLNLYSYCHNDPVNKVDVLGLHGIAISSQDESNRLRAMWLLEQLVGNIDNPWAPSAEQIRGYADGGFGAFERFTQADHDRAIQLADQLRSQLLVGNGPSLRNALPGETSQPHFLPAPQMPDVSVHALTTALGGPPSQEMAQLNAAILWPAGAESYVLRGALGAMRLGRFIAAGETLERAMLINNVGMELRAGALVKTGAQMPGISGSIVRMSVPPRFCRLGDATTSPWLADPRMAVMGHLERFRGGGSWVMTKQQYDWFVKGKMLICDPASQFITTKQYMDTVFANTGGNIAAIERALGFESGHFGTGGGLIRVDVHNPLLHNIRLPSGLERGANANFRWGGYTSGGVPEAVVNPFNVTGATINYMGL